MTLDEALHQACSAVGIVVPRGRLDEGKWIKADTLDKHGKGDGRIIVDPERVTAHNWQLGASATVWLKDGERSAEERRAYAQRRQQDELQAKRKADQAAHTAERIVGMAAPGRHPYLAGKGFPDELPLTIDAETIVRLGATHLVPELGKRAIVVPVRIGSRITSVQAIWEDGTKKFLFGGQMGGASHRLASGAKVWRCEGYATGLSLRAALKAMRRQDAVLMCFMASNLPKVPGDYTAADHDAPPGANPDQFGGVGAGEHYARMAGKPYIMPPIEGMDINDLHQREGIFAVQRLILEMIREAR